MTTEPPPRIVKVGVDVADGPDKLRLRLHKQTDELRKLLQTWIDDPDAEPLRFDLLKDGWTIAGVLPARTPPDLEGWGILFAEAVHTARSALNGLVSQLARIDGAIPAKPKRVQYPIARSEKEWKVALKDMESLPEFATDRLRAAQPFLAPDRPTFLELLADVDNDHKHDGVLIEAVALPLGIEATGLAILTEGGGTATQGMYVGPLDFLTDRTVYTFEFPKPVKVVDGHTPKTMFGIELLFDHNGDKVNFVDLLESLPLIVDGLFDILLTGQPPTGPGWSPNEVSSA
jgi:hypothetical protein